MFIHESNCSLKNLINIVYYASFPESVFTDARHLVAILLENPKENYHWQNKAGKDIPIFFCLLQDIIDKMNTQYKLKLMNLRTSGERVAVQDDSVTGDEVTEIINSSQKDLEGLQGALELRKLR